jgi:hypothetical protein
MRLVFNAVDARAAAKLQVEKSSMRSTSLIWELMEKETRKKTSNYGLICPAINYMTGI